jgi:hypothetical protein
VAAGQETKKMSKEMVDSFGGLEAFGTLGQQVGEVLGIGG